jgi:hypothetical protein
MTLQHQEQATGAAIGAIPATATLLAGADPVGLMLGLFAAVMATFLTGAIDSRTKAAAGIFLATALAGYGAPVMGQVLLVQFPSFHAAIEVARPIISLVIGALSPTGIVAAATWIKGRGERP